MRRWGWEPGPGERAHAPVCVWVWVCGCAGVGVCVWVRACVRGWVGGAGRGGDGTGLGVGGARGEGTVPVPLRREGRFCPAENSLPSGARGEQVSLQSTAMHRFRPVQKKKKKKKEKDQNVFVYLGLCSGPRPKTSSSVSKGSDRMGGRVQVNPWVKRSTESVTAVTRAFFRNRPIWMIPWTGVTPGVSLKGSS